MQSCYNSERKGDFMRLDKFLAHNELGSRKEVRKLLKKNRVKVNDTIIKDPSYILDIENDRIYFDDTEIKYKKDIYIMLNKPQGYVCSHDEALYPSVLELIDEQRNDLFMIGRLDVDTEGLLLITNDGLFSHNIAHGKKEIYKTYHVELEEEFNKNYIKQLESGLRLDDELLKPANVKIISDKIIHLSIAEGKYHQVKRMMHACNNEVKYLKRIQIGDLKLDNDLKLGEYRELHQEEISLFKKGDK